ncbi:MAG: hypothetical protein AUJ75_01735 [Candidatus Omnitrophica bacterium CG1_02_49_10]|nr:MAG: hypothetical protein AUJ75_01735 [Candidatus Omnitrophica bacterium CG1_02_49_10]
MEKIYTTKEVVERIGVSKSTLYQWLRKGKVSEVARDRNNARVFSEKDIKAIMRYRDKYILPGQNGS